MKLKINAILRGSDIVVDPGDVIEIDEVKGNILIKTGVAEEIIEDIEDGKIKEEIVEPEVEKPIFKKKR